jgi:hypothetical protein
MPMGDGAEEEDDDKDTVKTAPDRSQTPSKGAPKKDEPADKDKAKKKK